MAVNESRSMNADLREGLTDGTVKKIYPNRGCVTDPENAAVQTEQLHTGWGHYDFSFSPAVQKSIEERSTIL